MKISMIAAVGENNELGKDNHLLFDLPSDLKFFKKTTLGHPIVMGKNTFLSIGRPLPGRKNIVLSRNFMADGIEVYNNIENLLEYYQNTDENLFIIGGASVYKEFIDLTDDIYLTEVMASAQADTYFPNFDKANFNKEEIESGIENNLAYSRVLYRRKNER